MLRFKKKVFGGYNYKSKIFVIGYRIAGREDRVVEPSRHSMRHGDNFYWLGVGKEAILRNMRLQMQRSVCRAHGCSAPFS